MTQNKIERAMFMAAGTDDYSNYRTRVAVVRELWPSWEWLISQLELPADCFWC